jgi:hypothetical protein
MSANLKVAQKLSRDGKFNKAIITYFELLQSTQISIDKIENDLSYCLISFTNNLTSKQQQIWLWEKAIELTNNQSCILLYSYAR